MFGLGFTEVLVLLIVGIVVVGPQKLPVMMRTAGQWITKLRRMSTDLRSQSGIDEIIRAEGLEKEIRELKSLSRINVMDSLVNATTRPAARTLPVKATAGGTTAPAVAPPPAATAALAPPRAEASGSASASTNGPAPGPSELASATAPASGTTPATSDPRPPGAPPPGAIAASPPFGQPPRLGQRRPVVMVPLAGEEPLPGREWPVIGCDAYDALPDDLDEQEAAAAAEAAAAEAAAAEAAAATVAEAATATETATVAVAAATAAEPATATGTGAA